MKKISIIIVLAGSALMLSSYHVHKALLDNALVTLGISDKDFITRSFFCASDQNCTLGAPHMTNLQTVKVMATGDKVKLAKETMQIIKDYIKSPEFKTKYEDIRMANKPATQEVSGEMREMYEQQLAELEEVYTPELLASLPQEAKDGALYSLEMIRAMLNGEMDPAQKKNWEEKYPADPNVVIKRELSKFLENTKNVDYAATTMLNAQNKREVFTNMAYEKKHPHWKYCYRAGKEVSEATRSFAQQWLTEL